MSDRKDPAAPAAELPALKSKFEELMLEILPIGCEPNERIERERMFFAGALASTLAYNEAKRLSDDGKSKEAVAMIKALHQELRDFVANPEK